MEELITTALFTESLCQLLKIVVHTNMGTNRDDLLTKCVQTINKFTDTSKESSEADIRKCLKRFNLSLKTDNGEPISLKNKNAQSKILDYLPHKSISNNDFDEFIEYASKHNSHIISGIPVTFMLNNKKDNCELIWEYIRYLFYMSEVIMYKSIDNKNKLLTVNATNAQNILINIAKIESNIISEIESNEFINISCVKKNNSTSIVNQVLGSGFPDIGLLTNVLKTEEFTQHYDKLKDVLAEHDIDKTDPLLSLMDDVLTSFKDIEPNSPNTIFTMISKITQHNMQGKQEQCKKSLNKLINVMVSKIDDNGDAESTEISKIIKSLQPTMNNLLNNNGPIDPTMLNIPLNMQNILQDITKAPKK